MAGAFRRWRHAGAAADAGVGAGALADAPRGSSYLRIIGVARLLDSWSVDAIGERRGMYLVGHCTILPAPVCYRPS